MQAGRDLLGALLDTPVAAGAGGLIVFIFGYLFKELRRKDDGVWAIIADRDRQIEALTKDRDFWRDKVFREEDEAHERMVRGEQVRHDHATDVETDRHRRAKGGREES